MPSHSDPLDAVPWTRRNLEERNLSLPCKICSLRPEAHDPQETLNSDQNIPSLEPRLQPPFSPTCCLIVGPVTDVSIDTNFQFETLVVAVSLP